MIEATHNSAASNGSTLVVQAVIVNDLGLHARPAAEFVKLANQYKDCQITIKCDELEVNGKSIMGLLMLAAGKGTTLKLIITGPSRLDMANSICALISSGFGEEISSP